MEEEGRLPLELLSLEERMSLAQQGDKAAYNHLLNEVSVILRRYLTSKLSGSNELEDVLQEILISIHNARHTYDQNRPFKPWFFAIAKFRLYDYLRKVYRKKSYEDQYQEGMVVSVEEDVTEDTADYEQLYRVLADLPPKQRKIVELMKIEGYTAKEVAKQMNMSESAVKVSAHRTYKILRDKMKKAI